MSQASLQTSLAARPRLQMSLPGYSEAAVLVPIIVDDEGAPLGAARLVFTVRQSDMRTHAGQISFPGGRRDPHDTDLVAAALREAEEEIGIAASSVRVLGLLDDVPTPSQYVITPVVGLIRGPITLRPQAREVAALFDCTLTTLADPALYRDGGRRTFEGVDYVMHEYRVGEHLIWGATARIVHQLLELERAP